MNRYFVAFGLMCVIIIGHFESSATQSRAALRAIIASPAQAEEIAREALGE